MKIRPVLRVTGVICLVVSSAMLLPLCLALWDNSHDAWAFTVSFIVGGGMGLGLWFGLKREARISIGIREGLGITSLSWIAASALGALPYSLGAGVSYTDAFFEAVSGFTTTGATIMTDIEALPRGILLWRSLTHWMGGMGIIVLSLAVLPFLGVSGMEMYKAEVPGLTAEKVTPRLHQTALRLWGVYVFLTLLETVFLMAGGMSLFEAFAHSCSTIATGGFSTRNSSIAGFGPYVQWVIVVFMALSGVNFSLYFLLMAKNLRDFFADEELRAYLWVIALSVLAMSLSLWGANLTLGLEHTIRRTAFHIVSVLTTTGFVAEDYNLWPEFTRFMFILLTFCGACGGSTGGGCKVSRFIILWRKLRGEISGLLHPRAIITSRFNSRPITREVSDGAMSFFVLYFAILATGTLITSAFGLDIVSAFTGVLTCLSNVGPGLHRLGPVENFAWLPGAVKWLFSLCMLAGRLELFAVFLLFWPETYRR
ncbi:MAG: TrkH family potassium uptake protein [Synergistaceae bacterium]|nr:TrkH family potassium uptake protein [Synergistaceae bacterium]